MTPDQSTDCTAAATLATAFHLPPDFRDADVLAFHRRDAQQLAERVDRNTVQKGLCWHGRSACLSLRFDRAMATAALEVDGAIARDATAGDVGDFERMVQRMLGLTQPIAAFEAALGSHAQVGALIARNRGLRVPLTATPFEALAWAIAGQQISVTAALSLRRRLIATAGMKHSATGLACHPDAVRVAAMDEPMLRAAGFSQAKARTLLGLARAVTGGALPLDGWVAELGTARGLPADEIRHALSALYGIGPWTIDYALLRGFGWVDGSLHGDVAVRRRLQALLGADAHLSEKETRAWLAEFSPWRALVAAHLWAGAGAVAVQA